MRISATWARCKQVDRQLGNELGFMYDLGMNVVTLNAEVASSHKNGISEFAKLSLKMFE